MYLVTIGSKRELLYVTFAGHVDSSESRHCREEIESLLPTLQRGFRLLTDLKAVEQMDPACADDIRAIMDQLREAGLSQVIRVIAEEKQDIGFTVMSYFHYSRDINVQTFRTLAEALAALKS